jgi:hypothetical protein
LAVDTRIGDEREVSIVGSVFTTNTVHRERVVQYRINLSVYRIYMNMPPGVTFKSML